MREDLGKLVDTVVKSQVVMSFFDPENKLGETILPTRLACLATNLTGLVNICLIASSACNTGKYFLTILDICLNCGL